MLKIKKILAFCYAVLFVNKEDRLRFMELFMCSPFIELHKLNRFLMHRIKRRSVLIIESLPYHGEVIPGFVRYFNELGYHVDVLAPKKLLDERPFDGLGLRMNTFDITLESLALLLSVRRVKRYDYSLINTLRVAGVLSRYHSASFNDYFKGWPASKNDALYLTHDTREIEDFFSSESAIVKRAITLGRFSLGRMVNSHYFGEVIAKDKNELTTFIIIGAISSEIRNHQQLFGAAETLLSEGREFKVTVVGSGDVSALPEAIREHVEIKGRLNFPDMYQALREADFIITGLDPDNVQHERYITTGVTGTAQLSYGFEIPPVVEGKFADFYGFDPANALVYDRDLTSAMRAGIDMSNADYAAMRSALGALAKSVRDESMQNLEELMKASNEII